jgi:hypothetical protein
MGVLLAILVLLMIFTAPAWPYSTAWGYYPSGGFLVLLIVMAIVFFTRPRRMV